MNRQGVRHTGPLAIWLITALGCGGGDKGRREVSIPAVDRGVTRNVPALCPTSHPGEPAEEPPEVDQSAGLFVGAASFLDRSIGEVAFACDDAVDLAYQLSKRLDLLSPGAVVLLLSGTPAKDDSRVRLEWLRKAGARVEVAERSRVESLTEEMAKRVGPRGMLVMAFATHGYAIGGKHYLLVRDSSVGDPKMSVSVEGLMHLSPLPECARRLVFLDVCRQQREWPDARVDLPGMLEAIKGRYGVLSAASPGGASFPDYVRRNGIFTGALLGGLRCPEQPDPDGFLKLHRVALSVSDEVQARSHALGFPVQAPEESLGGGLADFALLRCGGKVGQILTPRDGDVVGPEGQVEVKVLRRGFYLTAVLHPVSDGGYFPQHLSSAPAPAEAGSDVFLTVDYGNATHFQVYVGFSVDPQFLNRKGEVDTLPVRDAAGRLVHWLGPVNVRVRNS